MLWAALLTASPLLLSASPLFLYVEPVSTAQEQSALESLRPTLSALGFDPISIEVGLTRCDNECAAALVSRAQPGEAYILSIFVGVHRLRVDVSKARDPSKLWRVIEGAPGSERWRASLREAFVTPEPVVIPAIALQPAEPPQRVWWLSGAATTLGVASVVFAATYAHDQSKLRGPIYDDSARAADDRRQVTGPLSLVFLGGALGLAAMAMVAAVD